MLTERIAINPSLFADEESMSELIYALKRNIKWSSGRTLTELPKGWYSQVEKTINTSTNDLFKTKVKDALYSHKFELIPILLSPPSHVEYWDEYIEKNKEGNVSGFFSSHSDHSKSCFLPTEVNTYLDESDLRVGSFETSGRTVEEIISAIDDFLFLNKMITLVNPDQWFSLGKSKRLFEGLMTRWIQHGGVNFKVIRSRRGSRANDVRQNWSPEIEQIERLLRKLGYRGKFRFTAVNDDRLSHGRVLHDRFLLGGKTGGIQMGYGLELTNPPKSNRWTIMSPATYRAEKAYFMDRYMGDIYEDDETDLYDWFVNLY